MLMEPAEKKPAAVLVLSLSLNQLLLYYRNLKLPHTGFIQE